MRKSYKDNAIILRRSEYQDADRIYTVLTPTKKRSLIARGIRKPHAKLASHMELFSEVELMCIEGANLDVLTSARTKRSWQLSEDYDRLKKGFLFLEMVDKMTDTEGTEGVYELLSGSLDAMQSAHIQLCELYFKLNLLNHLGHLPDLSVGEVAPYYRLDVAHGGLEAIDAPGPDVLSQDQIKLWRLLVNAAFETVAHVGGAEVAAEESIEACNRFIAHQFHIHFRSGDM